MTAAATVEKEVTGTVVVPQRPRSASLVARIGERFGVDPTSVMQTLRRTAFRQKPDKHTGELREATNEEMMALLIIAEQYDLNPFTRELYAFLDPKSGAIVPIVSVDGWLRIINSHPQLSAIEFRYSEERVDHKGHKAHDWIECIITRKDRTAPIVVREFFDEVCRKIDYTPWDTHPNRMHRTKCIIQCGRIAFGFAGVYDPDEAERIYEGQATRLQELSPAIANINAAVTGAIEHNAGETVPSTIDAEAARENANPVAAATGEDPAAVAGLAKAVDVGSKVIDVEPRSKAGEPVYTFAQVSEKINAAKSLEQLSEARDLIRSVKDPAHRRSLNDEAAVREKALRQDDGK